VRGEQWRIHLKVGDFWLGSWARESKPAGPRHSGYVEEKGKNGEVDRPGKKESQKRKKSKGAAWAGWVCGANRGFGFENLF
jgi:hypothetical protein